MMLEKVVDLNKSRFTCAEFEDALAIVRGVTVDVLYADNVGIRIRLTKAQIAKITDDARKSKMPINARWAKLKGGLYGIHITEDSIPSAFWQIWQGVDS